jgi:hypothetical protein
MPTTLSKMALMERVVAEILAQPTSKVVIVSQWTKLLDFVSW